MTALETRWTELISANIQLEIANFTLQSELRGLEDFEARLRARLQAAD